MEQEKQSVTEKVAEFSKKLNELGVYAGAGMIGLGMIAFPGLVAFGAGFTIINGVSYYISDYAAKEARRGQTHKS